MSAIDLDSLQGRRMVDDAAWSLYMNGPVFEQRVDKDDDTLTCSWEKLAVQYPEVHESITKRAGIAVELALKAAMDTTCPKCKGEGVTGTGNSRVACLACGPTGKVLPAFYPSGPGTPYARMQYTWQRMSEDEDVLARVVGYSPLSSMYPLEVAYVDAFRKLASPDDFTPEQLERIEARALELAAQFRAGDVMREQVRAEAVAEIVGFVRSEFVRPGSQNPEDGMAEYVADEIEKRG